MWLSFSRERVSKHCDCKGQACMVPFCCNRWLCLMHSMLQLVRFFNQSIKRSHKFSRLTLRSYMAPCAFN